MKLIPTLAALGLIAALVVPGVASAAPTPASADAAFAPADREYGPGNGNDADPADREYGPAKGHRERWCAQKFDEAQRADMESFRDFDAETWEEGHADNAVSIYPSGARFAGITDIMAAQQSHFANREAVWSWEEVSRQVNGCTSGFIEYVAVYEIPRTGYYQRAHTIVSYLWTRHGWKSVLDQGTMLEVRTG